MIGLGLATLGAGIIGGAASAYGAHQSGVDTEKAVKRQIEWERERATHAHQWEIQDLKNAGLNPILSAGGSGAVTGGISAPVPDRSGYSQAGTAMIEAMNSAYQAAQTNAAIGKTGAETANITQDTKNKITQQELIQKQIINEALKSGLISAKTANIEFNNLTAKYYGERAALSYWNEFLNTASNTAKNVTDVGMQAIDHFIPTKHKKELMESMGKGWKYSKLEYN